MRISKRTVLTSVINIRKQIDTKINSCYTNSAYSDVPYVTTVLRAGVGLGQAHGSMPTVDCRTSAKKQLVLIALN